MFDAEKWQADQADFDIWGDASGISLMFWSPKHQIAHIADLIINKEGLFNIFIFFNEAVTVLTALQWASSLQPPPKHLAIHADSTTSFGIFNSLCALDHYNPIILESVKIQIKYSIDLHVFHIEGKKNTVTDALSPHSPGLAHHLAPGLINCGFMPPLSMMEAAAK